MEEILRQRAKGLRFILRMGVWVLLFFASLPLTITLMERHPGDLIRGHALILAFILTVLLVAREVRGFVRHTNHVSELFESQVLAPFRQERLPGFRKLESPPQSTVLDSPLVRRTDVEVVRFTTAWEAHLPSGLLQCFAFIGYPKTRDERGQNARRATEASSHQVLLRFEAHADTNMRLQLVQESALARWLNLDKKARVSVPMPASLSSYACFSLPDGKTGLAPEAVQSVERALNSGPPFSSYLFDGKRIEAHGMNMRDLFELPQQGPNLDAKLAYVRHFLALVA